VWVRVLRKRKKSSVVVDQPRPSKPIAVVLTVAAFAGCCAIVFNTFFNQGPVTGGAVALSPGQGTTRVTVESGQKTSRTIVLKYDALVEDVQRELLATGHFEGLVDGVTGPRTKVAIEAYQRENKLDVTGEISNGLLEHIRYTHKLNQAAEFTGSVTAETPLVAPAKAPLAQLPKPAKKILLKLPVASGGDNAVSKLQTRLAVLGYDPGSRSGQLDEGTRSAILIFEMDHGLPMQGKISKALLTALKTAETKK
jgi:peptidoglycan hydrolase-like protein with peptidoglycan-binding domain